MSNGAISIAVVIPFYQREIGILGRAVASVLKQDLPDGVSLKIVVIDDASPVAAVDELAKLGIPAPHELQVISQPNGGPGAARNRGLDTLDPDAIRFVAFLDSDDEWHAGHISTALAALGQAHDFYFCDHTRSFDTDLTWFEDSAICQAWRQGARHPAPAPLPGHEDIFSLPSAAAFDAFVEEYLSHTSTVVYRFDRHPALRFDTALRSAGEDYMFWLSLAQRSNAVVFSTRRNVACGQGVNIYFSAFDWDNPQAAARHGYRLLLRIKLMRNFELTPEQADLIGTHLKGDGEIYAYLLVKHAARGRWPDWSVLARLSRLSPRHVAGLPLYLLPMLRKRRRNEVTGRW
jgi:succinoglycan biosynthesis protein ExoW